ncbi:MAG: PPOX class F420-dependent oxidoreductase [Chloroflexi bacterium]|nr:MAG: PPOX class F420-dependent oxidoreductase [Chloroflexota bacterium]
MALTLPLQVDEFLSRPNASVIGCVRPDGFPMTVATWYDWEDGRILVNMDAGRRRLAWIRLNPKVSLTVFGDDWSRHVSLYGLVATLREDSDLRDIDRLARRYSGNPFPSRTAKRVSAWIEPHGWHGWDLSGELSGGGPLGVRS